MAVLAMPYPALGRGGGSELHHQLGYEAVAVAVIGRSAMSPKDFLEVETQQGIDLAVGVVQGRAQGQPIHSESRLAKDRKSVV